MQNHPHLPATRAQLRDEARAPSETGDTAHWTPARQGEFLRALAASHCVATAARSVGMSRQSAYRLRNRLRGGPFDSAWRCAFRRQFDTLAEIALERAVNGREVPHYYKGQLVGTHRVYDGRLTMALLTMQQRLTRLKDPASDEEALYHPDDFAALVQRVEQGGEEWADELAEEAEE